MNEMTDNPVKDSKTQDNDLQRRKRYEQLVDTYYQDVYRYAFWLCKNQAVAQDLVQETFLRAWRALDSLQSDKAAKAWLFTILRRENARMYERYRPELVDVEDVPLAGLDEGEPDRRMDRELLYNAINQLESDYRDPLLLQVIGGFSGKEIASILDLNSNTVMTRLFRARSKLRDMFGTSEPDQDPET